MTGHSQQPPHGQCGAETRGGGTCQQPQGFGTTHPGSGRCKFHGGSTQNGEKHAKKEEAKRAVAFYGLSREVDPQAALLEELHRTAGHVAWLSDLIQGGKLSADLNPTGRERAVKLDQSTMGGDIPSVWVSLYQEERRHLAAVAKTCISVGIEERRVQLAEQQGALIAQVIRGVLTDLGVADHPEAPSVVRRHLSLVAA